MVLQLNKIHALHQKLPLIFGAFLLLCTISACTASELSNCLSDADCPSNQRCLSGGGLIFQDAVCIDPTAQTSKDVQDTDLLDADSPDSDDDTDRDVISPPDTDLLDTTPTEPEDTDETDADIGHGKGSDTDPGFCPADQRHCDGVCVDTARHPDHCGQCDNSCEGEQICSDHQCACPAPHLTLCDSQCVDTQNDPNNCGGCADQSDTSICVSGLCINGQCSTCDPDSPRFGGGDGTVNDPYTICSVNHLYSINDHLNAHFELTADLDLSQIADFWPIAGDSTAFTGVFDGQGHTIKNLTVIGDEYDNQALFGVVNGIIKNLTLKNAEIQGENGVAALAGLAQKDAQIQDVYITQGTVKGIDQVGGLVGANEGTIKRCAISTDFKVLGEHQVGGLVGTNRPDLSHDRAPEISQSWTNVTVEAQGNNVGGLVGTNYGNIFDSYATGDVSGEFSAGGLIGLFDRPANLPEQGIIDRCFATGAVSAAADSGGLVGIIIGIAGLGGFPSIERSFYLGNPGCTDCDNGLGAPLSAAEFRNAENFTHWNFDSIWKMSSNHPILQWEE